MTAAFGAARPRRVLIDSSGFLAFVNPRDTYHLAAKTAWAKLIDERWSTFTTNYVVAETHALFLTRLGRTSATDFLRNIDASAITIVRVSRPDELRARAIIFRYDDKDFSFTDAVSFAVMERLRIGVAFGFDHNFVQYGFRLLGAETS